MKLKTTTTDLHLNNLPDAKRRSSQLAILNLVFWISLAVVPSASAASHQIIVTNLVSIPHGEKWKPKFWFGNLDDPVPPPDYRPNDRHRVRKWYYRNPTHNFTFYVIGVADKTFRRCGRCPDQVFNPQGGWNWTVCKYKWVRLPFISFQKRSFSFYLGWRERGNFGAKLTFP